MSTDPIADLLTKIRNAFLAKKEEISCPYSKIKEEILKIMKKEGFISDYKVVSEDGKQSLFVVLNLELPSLNLEKVSKPGRRQYASYKDIKPVMYGYGIGIMSTSEGLMTFKEAKKKKLGGEVITHIW